MHYASVESIDALISFRVALWKFAEAGNAALGDTEGEMERMMVWLETEQRSHWEGQIRKRTELVARAKDALRAKKLFRSQISKPSTVEEEKALSVAIRRLEEADEKLGNVRKYARVLQKQILLYKGQVQRFANMLQVDIPGAVNHLDQLIASLEAYTGLRPTDEEGEAGGERVPSLQEPGGMSRPEPSVAATPPPEAKGSAGETSAEPEKPAPGSAHAPGRQASDGG